jgi:hypothetical protein
MGIDRIAGGPVGLPPQEVGGSARREPVQQGFEIAHPTEAAPVDPAQPVAPGLDPVQSGPIDVAAYLDQKVEDATSHLSVLPPSQLEAIRGALRDRLAADPSLVELVQAATGHPPPPRDD